MKWKVAAQFLAAFFIIAIVGNIISSIVTSFTLTISSEGRVNVTPIVSTDPKGLEIKKLSILLAAEGPKALDDPGMLDALKGSNTWVQILDRDGKELRNFQRPSDIQTHYSYNEIVKLLSGSKKIDQYNVFAIYAVDEKEKAVITEKEALARAAAAKKEVLEEDAKAGKEITVQEGSAEITGNGMNPTDIQNESGSKTLPDYICIIGTPETKITTYNILYSIYDYFTEWTDPKSIPKAVSTGITCLLALLLGYIFARGITRPVVKITDGIAAIAGGNYNVQYPEKGLYKQVYGSLNNTVKALKVAEIERKRVEQMREDWIVNLSHDLKTPLSSIKGYGELLLEPDYELTPEERKRCSEIIMSKTAYIEMLLDDLKLTQKLKNDLMPLHKTTGNLVELLREVVIDLLNDPKYANRKVVFEPEEEKVLFQYDAVLLQRAFTNILFNAVVHNNENTLVQVGISMNEGIRITVSDNGGGISEEDQKNLFERYYRGTNTESCASGSGLGLAIAKQVIEAHGGGIVLESEVGKGTRVKITF